MKTLKFAHISDTHLLLQAFSPFTEKLLAEELTPSMRLALCLQALAKEDLDFVIHTGDISYTGAVADYQQMLALSKEHIPNLPIFFSMGNHDNGVNFRQGIFHHTTEAAPYIHISEIQGLRIISLDTAFSGGMRGNISEDQLMTLEHTLQNPAPRGTIILTHHPLVCEISAFDANPSQRFYDIIESSDVVGFFSGHIHQSFVSDVKELHHIPSFTTGSLGFGTYYEDELAYYTNFSEYSLCTLDDASNFTITKQIITPATHILQVKAL